MGGVPDDTAGRVARKVQIGIGPVHGAGVGLRDEIGSHGVGPEVHRYRGGEGIGVSAGDGRIADAAPDVMEEMGRE